MHSSIHSLLHLRRIAVEGVSTPIIKTVTDDFYQNIGNGKAAPAEVSQKTCHKHHIQSSFSGEKHGRSLLTACTLQGSLPYLSPYF